MGVSASDLCELSQGDADREEMCITARRPPLEPGKAETVAPPRDTFGDNASEGVCCGDNCGDNICHFSAEITFISNRQFLSQTDNFLSQTDTFYPKQTLAFRAPG